MLMKLTSGRSSVCKVTSLQTTQRWGQRVRRGGKPEHSVPNQLRPVKIFTQTVTKKALNQIINCLDVLKSVKLSCCKSLQFVTVLHSIKSLRIF
jgi:hypothetical protein